MSVIPIRPDVAVGIDAVRELTSFATQVVEDFAADEAPEWAVIVISGKAGTRTASYALSNERSLAEITGYAGAILINRAAQER